MVRHKILKPLVIASLALTLVACSDAGGDGGEELGTCTITGYQAPVVRQNISSEECQQLFPSIAGATRMEWVPN